MLFVTILGVYLLAITLISAVCKQCHMTSWTVIGCIFLALHLFLYDPK
jgi:hypothetical protein